MNTIYYFWNKKIGNDTVEHFLRLLRPSKINLKYVQMAPERADNMNNLSTRICLVQISTE